MLFVRRHKVAAMRRFAFEDQDAPVIEAQQRNLNSASRVLTYDRKTDEAIWENKTVRRTDPIPQ